MLIYDDFSQGFVQVYNFKSFWLMTNPHAWVTAISTHPVTVASSKGDIPLNIAFYSI